jgi:hypothetical protein
MKMVARTSRRLPGFRFEVQSPQLAEALPRMDVAVFVGFAASGPIDTPVAVEDAAQFAAIFGEDAPLVWDKERGQQVYAYLAPAVRAFFRNGGRRCWIVRVARPTARSNYFAIPALARAEFDGGGKLKRITPAFAQARSEGSWSDPLRVSTALLSQPLELIRLSQNGTVADLAVSSPKDIAEGDLLRLTFDDEGYVLMLAVETSEVVAPSPPSNRVAMRVSGSRSLWFKTSLFASPPSGAIAATARVYTREDQSGSANGFESAPIAALIRLPENVDESITLDLHLSLADAPSPGSLVRVEVGADELWLSVQDLGVKSGAGSPPAEVVQVVGRGLWLLKGAPQPLPVGISAVEKLTFELWVKQGGDYSFRLSDLGFEAKHPRFWAELPTDKVFYQDAGALFEEGRVELAFEIERAEFWRTTGNRRFPLAGSNSQSSTFFPVFMPVMPDQYLGAVQLPGTNLERDGLDEFDATLFLDPDLVEVETTTFMAQADFLRYLSASPRRLKGIHAALGFGESTIIEEATVIAVPDIVHRGWVLSEKESPLVAEVSSPPARPEWWHFLDCDPPPEIPLTSEPMPGNFLDCDVRVIPAPTLSAGGEPDQAGTFILTWSSTLTEAGVKFVLEESNHPNFIAPEKIYEGAQDRLVIYGRSQGEYFYRVRLETKDQISDWSNGVGVRVSPANRFQLKTEDEYSQDAMLAVHRGLLRMCGARGDMLAVLVLPEHYREDAAESHIAALKSTQAQPIPVGQSVMLPLGHGEANDFSYAAAYHPWIIASDENRPRDLRRMPPDGAAAGVIAERAIIRGCWIAPANELMRGVVALTPPIPRERRPGLQEAQINLIRQEPRGFLALSADTLSDDPDLRPISVRRLMILLRRLALRLGSRYVFEPNGESLRRTVKRGFDGMLGDMFVRGAFAGNTTATSFQVITGDSLNTQQSLDQGRFIVELRVAPSLPMTFLTIRLVQTGDRALVTEGR